MQDIIEYLEANTPGQTDNRFWPKMLDYCCSTLDGLDPLVRVHDLASGSPRPLEILRLSRIRLRSGDLSPLAAMHTLRTLELDRLEAVGELPSLANLTGLKELILCRCPDLTDLTPLARLRSLQELSLEGTPVTDLHIRTSVSPCCSSWPRWKSGTAERRSSSRGRRDDSSMVVSM